MIWMVKTVGELDTASKAKTYDIPYYLIIIFSVLAIGIGIAGYIYYENQKAHIIKEKQNELSAIADLKASQITYWLGERLKDANLISDNFLITELVKKLAGNPASRLLREEVFSIIQNQKERYDYVNIIVLDAKGKLLISTDRERRQIAADTLKTAMQAVTDKKVIWTDIHRGRVTVNPHIDIYVPLIGQKDGLSYVTGIFVMQVDPSQYFFPLIQNWPTPSPSAETMLVRREGDEVVYINELRHKKDTALSLRLPITQKQLPSAMAVLGKEGTVEGIDYYGIPVIAAIKKIPDSPWFIVAKVDKEEIYEPVRRRARFISIIVIVLIIAAGLSVGLWWRQQRVMYYRRQLETEMQFNEERKKAEEILRASEVRYRRLFETAKDGILILDAETGMVVDANPFLIEMLGFSHEAFLGKKVWELGFSKDIVANQANFEELQQKEYVRYEDMPMETADGRRIEVEFVSNVYQVNHDKVIQCNIRDITERKKAEAKLVIQSRLATIILTAPYDEMYNEVLKVILDVMQSPLGVFGFLDDEGALVVPSMTRHVWDKCQVSDKTFTFPRDTWGDSSWTRAIKEKKPNYTNELSKKMPEGHIEIRRHISFPILFQNRVIGLLQVANRETDYTEEDIRLLETTSGIIAPVLDARLNRERQETWRKQALSDLNRSNEELKQFAYIASHDLQEPLRMIASYLQLIERRYKGKLDKDADEFIGFATDGATRLQEMIIGLLAYSRVGTKGKPFEEVNTSEVLAKAILNLKVAIEENGAIITADQLPVVRADAAQLVQLFQNLISNAIKFKGSELPRIHISAEKKDMEWISSVKDNGIGISPEYKDRIFNIFQRLHGREYPGVGIGLSICRRIIERHGGRIWLESETGKGTIFYFTIPVKEGEKV